MMTALAGVAQVGERGLRKSQGASSSLAPGSAVTFWREAPETWQVAVEDWLSTQASEHTRRAYDTAVRQFLGFWLNRNGQGATLADVGAAQLWRVTSADMRRWQRQLQATGLAATTVNARVLAISSFFGFCTREITFAGQAGELHKPLLLVNPCEQVRCVKVIQTPRAALSVEQVRALLGACERTTVAGARDYALIAGYLLTGQRNSELRLLRWGDLREDQGDVIVFWQGKGRKSQQEFLHPAVYAALRGYLVAAGRWGCLGEGDYVFTPLTDAAVRFPHIAQADLTQPISRQRVNAVIKAAARRAGLEARQVTTHTLRRTAARRFFEMSGNDLDETAKMLHHRSQGTTRVYLNQPELASREIWAEVAALYGFSAS